MTEEKKDDKCPRCHGRGTIIIPRLGGGMEDATCPRCEGSGKK